MNVGACMVFLQFIMMFTFLFSTCTMQSSQQSDDNFDIGAQCLAPDHQDYIKKCALQNFIASADLQQFIQDHEQEELVGSLVEKAEQDRTVLWQNVINDVQQERKLQQERAVMRKKIIHNELQKRQEKQKMDIYLKNKENTKLILAQQGLSLEGDSSAEFNIGIKNLEIIKDPMFIKNFQKLFDDNIFKLHTSLPRDVVEDKNRYFTLVAYQSFAEMNISKEAHEALWNAIKIKSCSSLVNESMGNQYQIVAPLKKSSTPIAQTHGMESSAEKIKDTVKKKKLTPAQQAKEDADAKFLDEQIRLRKEEAQTAQVNVGDAAVKQLNQEQRVLKAKQKEDLKAKITSLRNKDQASSQMLCRKIGVGCPCCQGMMTQVDVDNDSSDEDFQGDYSRCRQRMHKIDNNHYAVSTTVSEDLFIKFYQENPKLIALVDSYKHKNATDLERDLEFECYVDKFLNFMNIPTRQRIAMKAAMKATAALLWRDAHRRFHAKQLI